jgi:hypothetical protein
MRGVFLIIFLIWGGATNALAHDDDLCGRLTTYERLAFPQQQDRSSRLRWVELHWVNSWLVDDHGWGFYCRHSDDEQSDALCAYLLHNTSFEFADILPVGILECYGFRFPTYNYNLGPWIMKTELRGRTNRYVQLEVNFPDNNGDEPRETGAVRFAIFDDDPAMQPLPAIVPLTPGERRQGGFRE